jgi:hypothetical protein
VTRRRWIAALASTLAAAGLGGLSRPMNAPRGQAMIPGVQPGTSSPIVRALEVLVGRKTGVQLEMITNGSQGIFLVLYNNPLFTNAVLEGDIQGTFAQLFFNGPANTTAGHKDFVGLEMNSSDGVSSSANFLIIYNDVGGVGHQYFFVDSAGVHLNGPTQINGAGSTLPLAHLAQFPISGAATLATTIAATNALYAALVTGQVFAS